MDWSDSISIAATAVALFAAIAVLFRDKGSLASKLFAVGMVLLAAEAIIAYLSARQVQFNAWLRWQELRYVPLSLIPVIWIAFSLVHSRGNYREYLRKRVVLLLVFALAALGLLVFASDQFYIIDASGVSARFGIGAQLLEFIVIAGSIVVLMNLEQTFRTAVGTQRWKIKLVLLGVGGLFLVRIYTSAQLVIQSAPSDSMSMLNSGMLIITCALIGISVIRTRDFSIDLYPSQAALHRSVIVVILGVYLIIVGLLSKLAAFLGSDAGFEFRALVILIGLAGLGLLLMSDKLRERTRAFITRHFHRPHYNYQQVWTSFKRETAGKSTTDSLCPAIAKWISKTLNALSVTVWLIDEPQRNIRLAGSTLEVDQPDLNDAADSAERTVILQCAIHLPAIVNLDRLRNEPSTSLLRLHPRVFPTGGDRLAVPLVGKNGNLGIIIIGDRVEGVPFTSEDEELLSTVAEQASLELQAIQLSDDLMQAREMEAFQRMSTFFVHDLKNTASSLSLMLQNLPKHFDNPEFRTDALRSIEKSVNRIKEMIQSLSALRRRLDLSPEKVDLSAEIERTAETLASDRGISIDRKIEPTGHVNADMVQLNRVVTNLIVNAHEATSNGGHIQLATGTRDGHAFLEVVDNGEGMTEEFIQSKLFQPFQTTKKSGTGIGLYHSKMIVDAHRGKVEVRSQPGVGTTFCVLLPLPPKGDEA